MTFRFGFAITRPEAVDVTEVYRYRWSIEVFFRFLKSELHLENLLSYSEMLFENTDKLLWNC